MRNKGFTLIEVLAVVGLLAIIITIFVPNTIKLVKQNNLKVYKIKEKELLTAAEDYANYDNNFKAPEAGETKYISMTQLVNGGYMNAILDSSSGNECNAFVKVTKSSLSGYDYEPCLLCEEYQTDKPFCSLSTYNEL